LTNELGSDTILVIFTMVKLCKRGQKMKKIMRKVTVLLTGILLLTSLTACSKFDASAYVKAVLDNAYFNDATGILELGLSTEEEAAAVYNKGVESLVGVTLSNVAVSEALKAEYHQFYVDLYAGAKYTVGEATEIDENIYEVPVVCEKLQVFGNANLAYEAELQTLAATWTEAALAGEEVPSDEEKYEQFFTVYKNCLNAELEKSIYGEQVTLTVKVEKVNGVWMLNTEDRLNIEYALIDFEEMFETQ